MCYDQAFKEYVTFFLKSICIILDFEQKLSEYILLGNKSRVEYIHKCAEDLAMFGLRNNFRHIVTCKEEIWFLEIAQSPFLLETTQSLLWNKQKNLYFCLRTQSLLMLDCKISTS